MSLNSISVKYVKKKFKVSVTAKLFIFGIIVYAFNFKDIMADDYQHNNTSWILRAVLRYRKMYDETPQFA